MAREQAVEPTDKPGHRQKLRADDAETFLVQLAVRCLPGLLRAWPAAGVRRWTDGRRPREVARAGRHPAVDQGRRANGRPLQRVAEKFGASLWGGLGQAVSPPGQALYGGVVSRLRRRGGRLSIHPQWQTNDDDQAVRWHFGQPQPAVRGDEQRDDAASASGVHESATVRDLRGAAAPRGGAGGDTAQRETA